MSDNLRQLVNSVVSKEFLNRVQEFCLKNYKSLLAASGAAVIFAYSIKACYQAYRVPPGPLGLPVLGRLPWLDLKHVDESHEQMRRQYGDIYSYRLGSRLMVVVSSYELLKEMLDEDVFSGRQVPPITRETAQGCGILFTEGSTWAEQRRVSFKVLRDFGFAGKESVASINQEVNLLLEKLEQQPCQVKVIDHFNALTNSVIAMLVFGRRYANEDTRYEKFLLNSKYLLDIGLIGSLPFLFPYLARPMSCLPSVKKIRTVIGEIHIFMTEEISRREAVRSADSTVEGICLCDAYLREGKISEAKGDFETFKNFQLVQIGTELFIAGTDNTAKTLNWLMVHMAAFQDSQSKVHEEIRRVVGSEKRPQPEDRASMHYTQAVIDESMRLASLVPNSVSHRALADTYFHGHLIPSDAAIVPFLFGLHRNPKYWKRPYDFYPEHFLTEAGHYAPSKMLGPFSIGKRACPGESLARLEIFLAFSAIMQRYRVAFSSEYETKVDKIIHGQCTMTRDPGDNRLDFARI